MTLVRKLCNSARRVGEKMKLVQFKLLGANEIRIGVLKNDKVVDLNSGDARIPNCLAEFLKDEDALDKIKRSVDSSRYTHSLSNVKLLSPISKCDKVIGVMANFKDDCDKRNVPYSQEPLIFSKFASVITGPIEEIPKADECKFLDWEVEIAVIIGKKARNVQAANALDYVFGYTGTQDLTAKDWIKPNGQLLLSKNMEGLCPLGPCLVTADEFGDPHNKRLRTWVNGELKQDGNSSNMIHRIDKVIEFLTSAMTLLPGDVILTGTPYGIGSSQNPPQYLQKGDILETEIEDIGRMTHRIV